MVLGGCSVAHAITASTVRTSRHNSIKHLTDLPAGSYKFRSTQATVGTTGASNESEDLAPGMTDSFWESVASDLARSQDACLSDNSLATVGDLSTSSMQQTTFYDSVNQTPVTGRRLHDGPVQWSAQSTTADPLEQLLFAGSYLSNGQRTSLKEGAATDVRSAVCMLP